MIIIINYRKCVYAYLYSLETVSGFHLKKNTFQNYAKPNNTNLTCGLRNKYVTSVTI